MDATPAGRDAQAAQAERSRAEKNPAEREAAPAAPPEAKRRSGREPKAAAVNAPVEALSEAPAPGRTLEAKQAHAEEEAEADAESDADAEGRTESEVGRRVADVVIDTLVELGVTTFYGIPGGAISSIYDALLDKKDIQVITARHETGAAFMAMGHARSGGSFPVVLTTSGPGITNVLTGLASAYADGVPMLVISGEVPRKNFGRGALQEGSRYHLDVLTMVGSITKHAQELTSPRAAASAIRKAVAIARSGKQGPVFLSLPLDVANERVEPIRGMANVSTTFELDEEIIGEAAAFLQGSKRALILAGSGSRHPEAVRWIGAIASTLGIPVATTPKAKGLFPESDPLALGIVGLAGHPSLTEYLDGGIDVLLCVGCGLGEIVTNGWSKVLEPSKALIQVDIDAGQFGKNYRVDCGIVGPAHLVLRSLASRLHRRVPSQQLHGVKYLEPEALDNNSSPLHPARVIRELRGAFPEDTIFTADIGEHLLYALHYLRVDRPDAFIVSTGLGSMGSGLGAAIGAKMANPERPVVAICGDYGFQMFGMELATCVENHLGVVFAIFNDSRMKMVDNGLRDIFGRSGFSQGLSVDFVQLAESLGAQGLRIGSVEDFKLVNPVRLGRGVPLVLDIDIAPHVSFPQNGRVAQIRHFNSEKESRSGPERERGDSSGGKSSGKTSKNRAKPMRLT